MADRHHCSCFSIHPLYFETFKAMLDYYGFKNGLQLPRGQLYGRIKELDNDEQIHIRVMPSGVIEAEIELSQRYVEHLNPRYSRPAHFELQQLLNLYGIGYSTANGIPQSCMSPSSEKPTKLTPVRDTIIAGAIVAIALGVAFRKRSKRW